MHLSLPDRLPLLCFGFLSLQVSSVSNFHPDTRGRKWSLIQVHLLSCAVRREKHWKQMSRMCGECSQCLSHIGFAPAHGMCGFPVYTAQAPGCSSGEWSKVGLGLCALPGSKLLRFRFLGTPRRHRLSWACVLCLPQFPGAQVTRCLVSTLSQLGGASYHLLGPRPSVSCVHSESTISDMLCVSSGGLISDCKPPGGCQSSRIPGRLG